MRSEAVEQLLLRKEIPEYKISAKDWSLENPVYSNESFSGMGYEPQGGRDPLSHRFLRECRIWEYRI